MDDTIGILFPYYTKEDSMKTLKMFCFVLVLAAGLFSLSGCPKKAELASIPEAQKVEPAPVPEAEAGAEGKEEVQERAAAGTAGLQPVFFDFDSSVIREEARAVMHANAQWLKANPGVRIRVEGNCDDRGTREYNQALGQRRAKSAKTYLTDLGISSTRILLISYGKEKPVCSQSTEDCRQENRRGDFTAASE